MEPAQLRRGTTQTLTDEFAQPQITEAGGDDIGVEIATLAVQNGDAERTLSHEARDAQERAEANYDAGQVQALRDEASNMRVEGVFDAATAVATGCLKAECPSAAFATEAGGKLGDGFFQAAQHTDEANAAAHKAAADQARGAALQDGDAANDASAYVKDALDFYRTYAATTAQTQSAAIHRA